MTELDWCYGQPKLKKLKEKVLYQKMLFDKFRLDHYKIEVNYENDD